VRAKANIGARLGLSKQQERKKDGVEEGEEGEKDFEARQEKHWDIP
jgi:hypothetical protein